MISLAQLPPPAGPGDRVGIAALSGPVDPERLEQGMAALSRLGFLPVPADNLASRHGLFAGDDAERLAAFHRLAADPSLAAILFARGGHGVLRVLPGIDWDLLARRPRAYVGFSDLTPFLLGVVARLGQVAFHGPMVAADFNRGLTAVEEESFLGALAGRYPATQPLTAPAPRPPGSGAAAGTAAGPLLGGCLSLLVATLGTPYAADLAGSLFFWEEVGEPPYRIDRMLTHLRLSGSLDKIAGMLVGHISSAGEAEDAPGPSLPSQVAGALQGFSWPLAWGLESGHVAPNRTLPLGLGARLTADASQLVLGEG
jgi:muramoyltetrapeptide carboxypeptidase